MWTAIGIILAVLAIELFVVWLSTRGFGSQPYRVCQNGAGRYLVQHYQCVTPKWIACECADPRKDWRKYEFVTVAEFDTLEGAMESYRAYMASYRQSEADKRAKEDAEIDMRKKQMHDNAIVKIFKVAG